MSKQEKIRVRWSKTYTVEGVAEIETSCPDEALAIVRDQIGDYEGTMQYQPYEDSVEIQN